MSPGDPPPLEPLLASARLAAGDAGAALGVAAQATCPRTAGESLTLLRRLGELDLTVARVVEPHVDALMILAEAGGEPSPGTYGVFAAEAVGLELRAVPEGAGWRLSGTKPWCSLASLLDRALVTATTPTGRRLFDVDLHEPGVRPGGSPWIARGLTTVVTSDVTFDDAPARPVGPDGWYLSRPGFAWGGIRVAACWAGAAHALTDTLRTALVERSDPDPIRAVNLGRADLADWSGQLVLDEAARLIDGGEAHLLDPARLAARVRGVVAGAAEVVLREVGHALGPAPLAFDETHARRVADLTLYLRQHHAERDLASLGTMIAT